MFSLLRLIGETKIMLKEGDPNFRNLDPTVPIDVIGMKPNMDILFDPSCVPVRVTINKVNLAPNRNTRHFVCVLRKCGDLSTSTLWCSFNLSRIDLPVSLISTFTRNLISHAKTLTQKWSFRCD